MALRIRRDILKRTATEDAEAVFVEMHPRVGKDFLGQDGKRTLLSRYGWYVFFGMLYCGYKAAMEKAQATMAGMQSKKAK